MAKLETKTPRKKKIGKSSRARDFLLLFFMLLLLSPILYLLVAYYLDGGGTMSLFIAIFLVLICILVVFLFKTDSGSKKGSGSMLLPGLMGSMLLHRALGKGKSENSRNESLYWQESIRRKNSLR